MLPDAPSPTPAAPSVPPSSQPSPQPTPRTPKRLTLLPAIAVTICIATALLAWFFLKSPHTPVVPDDAKFVYTEGNFALQIHPGWKKVESVQSPSGFEPPIFAFKHEGTECTLAYVEDAPNNQIYQQTTPGQRLNVGNSQIDTWWYAPIDKLPSDFEPAFEGRQRYTGEVRVSGVYFLVPSYSGAPNFLLYMRDGTAVPDACDTESYAMLQSLVPHFDMQTLSQQSEGFVRNTFVRSTGENMLTFTPISERVSGRLHPIPYGAPFVVYDNKLYFKNFETGSLLVHDIFGNTTQPLPGIGTSTEKVVNRFYIRHGRLWYLLGPKGCDDYMSECNLELYEIPAKGGAPTHLASAYLETGSIMGYSPSENIVYIQSSFGDAGCFSYTIFAYSYETRVLSQVAKDGGCSEESGYDEAQARREAIRQVIGDTATTSEHVYIKDGALLFPIDPRMRGRSGDFVFPG